jgi:Fe-S-cluster containining protein
MSTRKGVPFSILGYDVSYPIDLSWQCQRCGLCCQDTAGHARHIRLLPTEVLDISRRTDIPVEELATHSSNDPYRYEMRKDKGKCRFLEGNVCQIYSNRPLVCRYYPFEMNSEGDSVRITLSLGGCVGSNKGKRLYESFFRNLAKAAIERFRDLSIWDTDGK